MPNMIIKIAQVIKSCETIPQLKSAKKYLDLWYYNLPGCEIRLSELEAHTDFEIEILTRIIRLENAQTRK